MAKAKPSTTTLSATEAAQQKGERLVLVSFLVGAIAVVIGMGLVSNFLSNNAENRIPLLVGFGAAAALTVALYLVGRRLAHKA